MSDEPARGGMTAVVAMTPEGVIGRDGDMPWRLKSDLIRFKTLTMGGWLVMGRKTFDSIGRPLPGRQTLVLTRNRDWSSPGVVVANEPELVPGLTRSAPAFVVGGAEIYRLLWQHCDHVLLTRVMSSIVGDTHLEVDWTPFIVRSQMLVAASASDTFPTEFLTLDRHNG